MSIWHRKTSGKAISAKKEVLTNPSTRRQLVRKIVGKDLSSATTIKVSGHTVTVKEIG